MDNIDSFLSDTLNLLFGICLYESARYTVTCFLKLNLLNYLKQELNKKPSTQTNSMSSLFLNKEKTNITKDSFTAYYKGYKYNINQGKAIKLDCFKDSSLYFGNEYDSIKKDNIIISSNNIDTYLEDFKIKLPSMEYLICRPNRKNLELLNLQKDFITLNPIKWYEKLFYNMIYSKSQILNDNNDVLVISRSYNSFIPPSFIDDSNKKLNYKKINLGDVAEHYYPLDEINSHTTKNIEPYLIKNLSKKEANQSLMSNANSSLEYMIKKTFRSLITNGLITIIIGSISISALYIRFDKILNSFSRTTKRKHLYCLNCKTRPTNILCKKCKNFIFYCSYCLDKASDNDIEFSKNSQMFKCENTGRFGIKCKNNVNIGLLVES